MCKTIKKVIIVFLLSVLFCSKTYSDEKLVKFLKDGEKIIFVRHAIAPGSGDPENFDIKNCKTQRNLNNEGIKQSKKIGLFFKKNNIPIDQVLSSEWCRCKDTAKYAFNKYTTFSALNSFYSQKFQKNKDKQLKDLIKFLKKLKNKKNLVLITHYVVILETLNRTTSSGEIIIVDKDLNFIGAISEF